MNFNLADAQKKFWQEKGLPICAENGWQRNPRLCADGKDGAIIVWEDIRTGSTTDLYAQRVDSSGKLLWDVKGVPVCIASGNQTIAGVVSDGNGGAIAAWTDKRGSDLDIYAQRINSDGTMQWTQNGIAACIAQKDQFLVKILSDNVGGAYLSWQDKRGTSSDIYAQRIGPDGKAYWQANGIVVCDEPNDQAFPEIMNDGYGGCIIVWADKRVEEDIYAQRFSPDGSKLWMQSGAVVTNESGKQFGAKVAELGDGGACIVWQDLRSGTTTDIYYQALDKNGNRKFPVTTERFVKSDQPQTGLSIIPDGVKGTVCAWTDYRGADPSTGDIYVRRMNEKGDLLWTPQSGGGLALCEASDAQENTVMINDKGGGAFAVWQDHRNTFNYDLYMNRIDAQGKTSFAGWEQNGSILISEDHNQLGPQIVQSGKGGAIIVWYDGRIQDGVADIYAQRVGFAPWFASNKNEIDFGILKIKTKSSRAFTIRNEGVMPMEINNIRVVKIDPLDKSDAEKDFTITTSFATPFTMQPGDSMTFQVEFKTDSSTYRTARIQFMHNAPASPYYIVLSGTGTEPKINVTPTQCAFGIAKVNKHRDSTFANWVTNPGNGILSIEKIEIDGTHKDQFEVVDPTSFPVLVQAGNSFNFTVRFKPTSDGYKTAKIKITNNATTTPKEISLSGSGAYPSYEYLPFAVNFDTTGVGGFRGKVFSIINSGIVELDLMKMEISGSDSTDFFITYYYPHTIAVKDTYSVWINFIPKKIRERRSTLKIYTDEPNSPEIVQMKGYGGVLNGVNERISTAEFTLDQNYPNPSQFLTTITYSISAPSFVTLKIFNSLGQVMNTIVNQYCDAGNYSIEWKVDDLQNGIYYYRLSANGFVETRKLVVAR